MSQWSRASRSGRGEKGWFLTLLSYESPMSVKGNPYRKKWKVIHHSKDNINENVNNNNVTNWQFELT